MTPRRAGNRSALRTLALLPIALTAIVAAGQQTSLDAVFQQAQQGDADAQAALGDYFASGRLLPQDFEAAARWRLAAAESGNARAQNALGKQLAVGLGIPRDPERASTFLESAARFGEPAFAFDLAMFYEASGDPATDPRAVEWLTRAVAAGHVGAHAVLGLRYYHGRGVERDYATASKLFEFASARGNARAQNNLGLMLSQGHGVKQDYERAVGLFQRAADQGLKEAFTNLAVMYENGFGVPFDEQKAVALYRQAATAGSLDQLLHAMGFVADPRIVVDAATAERLPALMAQARRGEAIAQFQAAFLLLGTHGVAADYGAASDLLTSAADNGISTAMTNLGLLYFRGLGKPQDYVSGFKWISLGADSGITRLVEARDRIVPFLSATQINDAQQMVKKYRQQHTGAR